MACCGINIFRGIVARIQNAFQTPFTPIVADDEHVAIPAYNVQDAINEISKLLSNGDIVINDTILPSGFDPNAVQTDNLGTFSTDVNGDQYFIDSNGEVLPFVSTNVPQIFSKVGGVQTTNGISHTENETATRTGSVVIGALSAPTTPLTKLDVVNGDIDIDLTTLTTGAVNKNGILWEHNTGVQNSFLGINAGNRTTNSGDNTGIGYESLKAIISGLANTAIGSFSLNKNENGSYNVALGASALRENVNGSFNVAVGLNALRNNLSNSNTAVGFNSQITNTTGSGNTSIGLYSLENNTIGIYNTASGADSLKHNTIGVHNTASGAESLKHNTIGGLNNSYGYLSLYSNISGNRNNAYGYKSSYSNVSGEYNSSFGDSSYFYNTINSNNTALGALSFNNYVTLGSGLTGTAISTTQLTLSQALTGSFVVGDLVNLLVQPPFVNTAGVYPGVYKVIDATTLEVVNTLATLTVGGTYDSFIIRKALSFDNSTAVGYDAQPTASNQVVLGDLNVTEVRSTGAFFGASFTPSDSRIKTNVRELSVEMIDALKSIRPSLYFNTLTGQDEIGIIAQDIPDILKPLVIKVSSQHDKSSTESKVKEQLDAINFRGSKEDFYLKLKEYSIAESNLKDELAKEEISEVEVKKFKKSLESLKKYKDIDTTPIIIEDFNFVDYERLALLISIVK